MMNATQASDYVFVLACAALVAHINVIEEGRREMSIKTFHELSKAIN